MGSIVVSEVYHPYAMFGGNTHLPTSHEAQPSHRSAPLRPTYTDVPTSSSRSVALVDTPMTDAAPKSATFSAPNSRPSSYAPHAAAQPASFAEFAPRQSDPAAAAQQLPPSPRIRGHESTRSASTPTSTHFPYAHMISPSATSSSVLQSPARPAAQQPAAPTHPARIKVHSLSHIQSFVQDETSPLSKARNGLTRADCTDRSPQYEISDMPVPDIIEMVAGLLTKITTTNDRQHEHLHRQIPPPDGTVHLSQQTNSVLAFHGKNVPSISILSYLSRIHKYCPTTYEVFLSLLVYFDRMTERVNSGPLASLRQANQQSLERQPAASDGSRHSSVSSTALAQLSPGIVAMDHAATPPPSGSLPAEYPRSHPANLQDTPPSPAIQVEPALEPDPYNMSHFFVVDSFNIHRLVIAGVTCASKFFSDIFYTNSRYAKVGGLPLPELNHLELQFLLLNDFRLAIPLEEMEAYGTMLVEFYAREVVAQQLTIPAPHPSIGPPPIA